MNCLNCIRWGAEHYLGVGAQENVQGYPDAPIGYVDDDVYEATRAFTGWSLSNSRNDSEVGDTGAFYYRADWHDRFQKRVLGQLLPADQAALADGKQVLDILAAHRGTAVYVCRKLCRRFISYNPPETLVQSAATVFQNNVNSPTQIKQVMRHILLSDAFKTTWGERVKRPLETVVSALRATQSTWFLTNDNKSSFTGFLDATGHKLFGWVAPDGYPDEMAYWLNSTSLFVRWRFINWLIDKRSDDDVYYLDVVSQTPATVQTPTQVIDFWIQRVFGRTIDAATRQEFIDFIRRDGDLYFDADRPLPFATDSNTQSRLRSAVALMLISPEFLWS